jgi:hypothetical protein
MSGNFLGQPGINLCWGESLYPQYLESTLNNVKEKGYQFLRIWLCRWGVRGLWHEGYIPEIPESACDLNQLSSILILSKKLGIKVILVIIPHAHFLVVSKYEIENPIDGWIGNPFREVSRSPYRFFYDQETRMYFQSFLAYLYNHFPLGSEPIAIELCNEIDMISGLPDKLIIGWHRQILDFCKKLNPQIALTTSTAVPDSIPGLLKLKDLDMISLHNYHFPYSSAIANLYYWKSKLSKFKKPIWLTEFDFSSQKGEPNISSLTYLQTAVLASACLAYETGPFYWWWDHILSRQIVPKLGLDIIREWLSQNISYQHVNKLIKIYFLASKKEREVLQMTRLRGKTLRFIKWKLVHKILSRFNNVPANRLILECGGNFLVLIEASTDDPVRVEIDQSYQLRGLCYNIGLDGKALASYIETTQTKSWTATCVQILVLQEI